MNRIQRLLAGVAILLLAACSTALPVAAPTEKPGEPATSVPTQAPIPSQTAAPTALPLAQQVTLTTLPFTENGKAPDYTIQLQIPALETVNGINDPRSDKFNEEVNILIQVAVDQFRKGLAEQPAMPISAGSFFDVRHVLISPPAATLSACKSRLRECQTARHTLITTRFRLIYDLEKGEQIRLSQLFLHGVNHLQTIADYCKAELSKRDIGFEQFAAGADPTEENYAVWNLSTEGLVIVFNEYQVTAYAAGPQTIIIPFDKLEKIISPDGLFGGMETIKMQQKPILIFDFGGVLLEWEPRQLFRKLFAGNEAAMEQFLVDINFSVWNLEFDRGTPFAQGVNELSSRFPHYAAQIKSYDERWEETIVGPIQDVVDLLYRLKEQGYALHGLTNWSLEKFELVHQKYPFFTLFDSIVVSGEIRLIKPDPRIYAVLLEQIKHAPEECLFIDDSLKNVSAARELGFMGIHFQSAEQLNSELNKRGITQ